MARIKESTKQWYYSQIRLCLQQHGKLSFKHLLYFLHSRKHRYPIFKSRITKMLQIMKAQGTLKYTSKNKIGYWELNKTFKYNGDKVLNRKGEKHNE
jgi:hypothetical protein